MLSAVVTVSYYPDSVCVKSCMRFYAEKLSQGKAFARSLKRWLNGRQFTDSQVAVFLASSLTHLFIEIDLGKKELYQKYSLHAQTVKLSEYVEGLLDQNDLKEFYRHIVGDELCSDPSMKTESTK